MRYVHSVLHRALEHAVRHGMIPRNPAALATWPRRDPHAAGAPFQQRVWSPAQTREFLAFIRSDVRREL